MTAYRGDDAHGHGWARRYPEANSQCVNDVFLMTPYARPEFVNAFVDMIGNGYRDHLMPDTDVRRTVESLVWVWHYAYATWMRARAAVGIAQEGLGWHGDVDADLCETIVSVITTVCCVKSTDACDVKVSMKDDYGRAKVHRLRIDTSRRYEHGERGEIAFLVRVLCNMAQALAFGLDREQCTFQLPQHTFSLTSDQDIHNLNSTAANYELRQAERAFNEYYAQYTEMARRKKFAAHCRDHDRRIADCLQEDGVDIDLGSDSDSDAPDVGRVQRGDFSHVDVFAKHRCMMYRLACTLGGAQDQRQRKRRATDTAPSCYDRGNCQIM